MSDEVSEMKVRGHQWYEVVNKRVGWRTVTVSASTTSGKYRVDVDNGKGLVWIGVATVKDDGSVSFRKDADFQKDTSYLKSFLGQVKPLVLEADRKTPKKKLKVLGAMEAMKAALEETE